MFPLTLCNIIIMTQISITSAFIHSLMIIMTPNQYYHSSFHPHLHDHNDPNQYYHISFHPHLHNDPNQYYHISFHPQLHDHNDPNQYYYISFHPHLNEFETFSTDKNINKGKRQEDPFCTGCVDCYTGTRHSLISCG